MRIGIPRALYYYQYYQFWETFFKGLGFEIVLSKKTNKQIVDWGVNFAVDGTCLPVKIYFGHVYDLTQQSLDYIFIPRIISIAKGEYICPKFMGLPDMISNNIPNMPKILSPIIDGRKGGSKILKAYLTLGSRFASTSKVLQAYYHGIKAQHQQEKATKTIRDLSKGNKQLTLGILGHEYIIHDDFLTMSILKQVQSCGHQIITLDSLEPYLLTKYNIGTIKRMFWTSGRKIIGGANYFQGKVDGIISLVAFSCGTDSLVSDLVERFSSRNQVPHLMLSLDEHTGEAGIITRLEAFLDMLERRKARETDSTAHGELLHSL